MHSRCAGHCNDKYWEQSSASFRGTLKTKRLAKRRSPTERCQSAKACHNAAPIWKACCGAAATPVCPARREDERTSIYGRPYGLHSSTGPPAKFPVGMTPCWPVVLRCHRFKIVPLRPASSRMGGLSGRALTP
eukprot:117482-Chlamydomonas_euryale.AAC.2